MNDNFYARQALGGAVFGGRTLIQATGSIGGHKAVFVKLIKGTKNALCYPTTGGKVLNPFKGRAKIYAGDFVEFNPGIEGSNGATVKIMKVYEVAKADTDGTGTTIYLVRDGYHHIPFVGDNIMVAPSTLTGKGTAVTITAVEKTTESGSDVYKVTVSAALGKLALGAVLVEAAEAGASKTAMVTNPNAYADSDMDFLYDPSASDDDFENARYFFTPCLAQEDTVLNLAKCGPIPPAVKALNKSRVNGWFWFV